MESKVKILENLEKMSGFNWTPSSFNLSSTIGPGTIGTSLSGGSFTPYGCLNPTPISSLCVDRFSSQTACIDYKIPFVPVSASYCADSSGSNYICAGPTLNAGKYLSTDLQACWTINENTTSSNSIPKSVPLKTLPIEPIPPSETPDFTNLDHGWPHRDIYSENRRILDKK